jgi:hypothetical protein
VYDQALLIHVWCTAGFGLGPLIFIILSNDGLKLTLFLVMSLVTPHIVYSTVDVASRSRVRLDFNVCLRYVHRNLSK